MRTIAVLVVVLAVGIWVCGAMANADTAAAKGRSNEDAKISRNNRDPSDEHHPPKIAYKLIGKAEYQSCEETEFHEEHEAIVDALQQWGFVEGTCVGAGFTQSLGRYELQKRVFYVYGKKAVPPVQAKPGGR